MFSGSWVAIITPFTADGSVDYAAWARLLEFHASHGTHGIIIAGSTGEAAALSDAELLQLTQQACMQLAGRVPVVVGAGCQTTAATVARVTWLSQLPIAGLMVVTPCYLRPTQQGLYLHYAAVDAATRLPIMLYNVPARTAVDLLPATVARLAELPNIRAIKEAVPEISRIEDLAARCPDGFAILSGDDPTACEAVLAGARGVVSVTANVAPATVAAVMNAALAGQAREARQLDARVAQLHTSLFVEPNPIPVKWAVAQLGLVQPLMRLPLTTLSLECQAPLKSILQRAGVLSE
jgi:4-hydroxy-tetrahydrodipicolinate synthase